MQMKVEDFYQKMEQTFVQDLKGKQFAFGSFIIHIFTVFYAKPVFLLPSKLGNFKSINHFIVII